MKILADKYLYKLDKLVPDQVKLHKYDPDLGFPENAAKYDALLIRTVTKVNPKTLPKAGNLKFIGSATAGFDHVDTKYLKETGVAFARSEGCNANAVGEYVITVLHKWAGEREADLSKKKIGVIGCGNTGRRVAGYLEKLNIRPVLYDPPKSQKDPEFNSVNLEELFLCDILTFHTPLTHSGDYPTFYMCNKEWLKHEFDLVINTARGGVVDETALIEAHNSGKVSDFILDVWENEPVFSDDLAQRAFIATPHVAGYSREAKWLASKIVVDKMCRFFGLKCKFSVFKDIVEKQPEILNHKISFSDFLWQNSNIGYYDTELRKLIGLPDEEKSSKFAKLRSETETRFEFINFAKRAAENQHLPEKLKIFNT